MLNKFFASPHRHSHALIVFNCIFLWLLFSFCRHYLDEADMVENYAWGINWLLGSNKHPQMFAWITAAWFKVFPTHDWAYYLLTELNLLVALILLMLAMRKSLTPQQVFLALILTLLLSPLSIDRGHKFNANIAQLPFIAGYAWALQRAIKEFGKNRFLIAGIFAGAAVLTKYSALVLTVSVSFALWFAYRPKREQFLPGMALTGAMALILISPHVYWSMQHDWPTLAYMHQKHGIVANSWGYTIGKTLADIAVFILGTIPVVLLATFSGRRPAVQSSERPYLGLYIFLMSMAGMFMAAWVMHISPTANWFIPCLLFFGWAVVEVLPTSIDWHKAQTRLKWFMAGYYALMLGLAIHAKLVYENLPFPPAYALPERLAQDVTRLYHENYHEHIHYAAGSFPLPYMMSFYSPDHPFGTYALDLNQSIWIDPLKFRQQNKVIICSIKKHYLPAEPDCSQLAIERIGMPQKYFTLRYHTYSPAIHAPDTTVYHVLMYHSSSAKG